MRAVVRVLGDYWLTVVVLVAVGGGLAALVATEQPGNQAPSGVAAAAPGDRTLAAKEAQGAKTGSASNPSEAVTQQAVGTRLARRARRAQQAPRTKSSTVSVPTASPGSSYIDCGRLGHVVSVTDPVGDVDASGNAQLAAHFRSVDLTRVSVAVAGETLCADFTAVAPPNASTFYSLFLERNAPNSAGVRIDVGSVSIGLKRAVLKYPGDDESSNHGIVPAMVGVAGNSTSVLIDRRVLPSFTPFPQFLWSAEAVGWTGLTSVQQVFDYAPDGYQPVYP